MKISAKNQLKGKVKKITSGPINCEVVIGLPGGEVITSIITKGSVKSLGLKPGVTAYAIIKASNVIIGVD
jgi:molybdate transport system regulatory protein